jgi:hypothetical protein
MSFRKFIPEQVFRNSNADNFVKVLDGIEEEKTAIIEKSFRSLKTPLDTNLEWLRKRCEEYGYPKVPFDFTKEQLDAMLLNVENVMALKGSKMGLYYWLWTLTFGKITIDDSQFYPKGRYIIPNDFGFGYVSHVYLPTTPIPIPAPQITYTLYLFSDVLDFGKQKLTVTIETKYWNKQSMRDYITDNFRKFVSFIDQNAEIVITFLPGVYNTYSEPYQPFVIP